MKGANLEQDLFVQNLKSAIQTHALYHIEEMFCDFIGLLIFGESYLHAYQYLLAPTLGGVRDFKYPEGKKRAEMLESFARSKLSIDWSNFADMFVTQTAPTGVKDGFLLDASDNVSAGLFDTAFNTAQDICAKAKLDMPSKSRTDDVVKSFALGVPFEGAASIGDLVNAALMVCRGDKGVVFEQASHPAVEYLSDLALKSAEIHEIRTIMK